MEGKEVRMDDKEQNLSESNLTFILMVCMREALSSPSTHQSFVFQGNPRPGGASAPDPALLGRLSHGGCVHPGSRRSGREGRGGEEVVERGGASGGLSRLISGWSGGSHGG